MPQSQKMIGQYMVTLALQQTIYMTGITSACTLGQKLTIQWFSTLGRGKKSRSKQYIYGSTLGLALMFVRATRLFIRKILSLNKYRASQGHILLIATRMPSTYTSETTEIYH